MTQTSPMVTVKNLSHVYMQGTPLQHRALDQVDLEVAEGECVTYPLRFGMRYVPNGNAKRASKDRKRWCTLSLIEPLSRLPQGGATAF